MPKVAVIIEKDASGQWKLVGSPSEDVAGILAEAREHSVARGAGENTLLVLSTIGVEKRYKLAPLATKKSKAKS